MVWSGVDISLSFGFFNTSVSEVPIWILDAGCAAEVYCRGGSSVLLVGRWTVAVVCANRYVNSVHLSWKPTVHQHSRQTHTQSHHKPHRHSLLTSHHSHTHHPYHPPWVLWSHCTCRSIYGPQSRPWGLCGPFFAKGLEPPGTLPGSLNRVPASAGVKAGISPLPGGR